MKKHLKTALSFVLALAMTAIMVVVPVTQTAYAATTIKAKSVTLNHKVYTIKKGSTVTLRATVSPKNATQKKIVWTTSNKKIATVKSGKVKGLKKGKVTITAKVKGTKKTAKATIYVGTPVRSVTVKKTAISIKKGNTASVNAKVNPSTATVKTITYTSSNKKVATVSAKGVITAKAAGKAVITAAPKDEAGKKAKVTVTVTEPPKPEVMKVAMVTDTGDIDDHSFNQVTYEACKKYCEESGIGFTYIKPAGFEDSDFIAATESEIQKGYNVIVTPGFAFANAIYELAPKYPKVKFVGVDLSEGDLTMGGMRPFSADNVAGISFREEEGGYMAGYAAVKLGYTKLGFFGGMEIPDIKRYGYGFIQGADAAAAETGAEGVEIKFTYGEFFQPSDEDKSKMENWYQSGTECVFSCGPSTYTAVAEAAGPANGKVIGVDSDQAPIIDGTYGEGLTLTSAVKDLESSVRDALDKIKNNKWDEIKGFNRSGHGILPDSTQWADGFTKADYEALREEILNGTRPVSDSIDSMPAATHVTVITD